MQRRRIAVITARADESEQSRTLKGIAAAALSVNTDVVVFSNRYNYWDNDAEKTYCLYLERRTMIYSRRSCK